MNGFGCLEDRSLSTPKMMGHALIAVVICASATSTLPAIGYQRGVEDQSLRALNMPQRVRGSDGGSKGGRETEEDERR
eukprot:c3534_g1_i1 orf=9-242(-)